MKEEPQGELLTIWVWSLDGAKVAFRVRGSTPWSQVANAWCARAAVDPVTVRFVFDTERCNPEATVAQLGLEDGDIVDAMIETTGD